MIDLGNLFYQKMQPYNIIFVKGIMQDPIKYIMQFLSLHWNVHVEEQGVYYVSKFDNRMSNETRQGEPRVQPNGAALPP